MPNGSFERMNQTFRMMIVSSRGTSKLLEVILKEYYLSPNKRQDFVVRRRSLIYSTSHDVMRRQNQNFTQDKAGNLECIRELMYSVYKF